MQPATLNKLRAIVIIVPFFLFLFKIYNLTYYIPVFILLVYMLYQNYQNLPQEEKKGFLLTKLILATLTIVWAFFYFWR